MYQIHWKSLLTGLTGHGETELPKEQVEQVAERSNREYKGVLVHWCQASQPSFAPDAAMQLPADQPGDNTPE